MIAPDTANFSNVDKRAFPGLLKQVVENGAFSRPNAIAGFQSFGIQPLNPQKIGTEKLSTATPLKNEPQPENTPVQLLSDSHLTPSVPPSTASSTVESAANDTDVGLSPRRKIEAALLSHFRQVTYRYRKCYE